MLNLLLSFYRQAKVFDSIDTFLLSERHFIPQSISSFGRNIENLQLLWKLRDFKNEVVAESASTEVRVRF